MFQNKSNDTQIVLNNYYARFYRAEYDIVVTKQGNSNKAVTGAV